MPASPTGKVRAQGGNGEQAGTVIQPGFPGCGVLSAESPSAAGQPLGLCPAVQGKGSPEVLR